MPSQDPKPSDFAHALDKALDAKDPAEFFDLLYDTQDGFWGLAYQRADQPLRMIKVLSCLAADTAKDGQGIENFLTDSVYQAGGYANDAVGWCRDIGATRSAEYLERAIEVFPNGDVPSEWLERSRALTAAATKALKALDREKTAVHKELATALRAYLRAHRDEALAALAAGKAAAERPPATGGALAVALSTTDAGLFLDKVMEVGHELQRGWPELDEQPESLRMAVVLRAIWLDVSVGGIYKFIDEDVGEYFNEAIAWAEKIGAMRTVEYLRSTAKHFPDERVPKDATERAEITMNLEKNGDPLRQLDEQFRAAASEEIPSRLRGYFATHQSRIEKELATRQLR